MEEHVVDVTVQQVIPQERFEEHAVDVSVQPVLPEGAIFGAN